MTGPLDIEKLRAYAIPDAHDDYDPRDVILYALGTGAGLSDDIDETSFLYERELQALPTMALVLGTPGFWPMDPKVGIDWKSLLHGEQRLKLHAPLDTEGVLIGKQKVTDIADKGSGKFAMLRVVKDLHTAGGTLVAEESAIYIIRGAGGFGGERAFPGEPLPSVPDSDPDFEVVLPTSRAQAATYRLSGDRNPLHIDPEVAQGVGFDRPVLHGLSTMGLVGRAIIHATCGGIAANLREINLRFSAPVYPGDTIRTQIWQDGENVRFCAFCNRHDRKVIEGGVAKVTPLPGL